MTAGRGARLPLDGSLLPEGLSWRAAPAAIAEELSPVFPEGRVEVAGGAGDAFRHLRGRDASGRRLFGARIAASELAPVRAADAFARLAAMAGVETAAAVGERAMADGSILLLRPWLDGVHPPRATLDFRRLGKAIARLHEGMSGMDLLEIEKATDLRLAALSGSPEVERWRAICGAAELDAIMGDWAMLARTARMDAVACHGDLHAGNILVRDDASVAIVDFEEAPHSLLNPSCDLARAFERTALVMADTWGAAWTAEAGKALLAGYLDGSGWIGRLVPFGIALAFHRALAVRTCLLRGDPDDEGWRSEVRKQMRLAELAADQALLIASLTP
jgi:hypothetical protein